MIGSERDALIDQVAHNAKGSRLGGPLAMFVLLLAVWVAGRTVLWEDPFPGRAMMAQAAQFMAKAQQDQLPTGALPNAALNDPQAMPIRALQSALPSRLSVPADPEPAPVFFNTKARLANAHHSLWQAALTTDLRTTSWRARRAVYEAASERQARTPVFPGTPPFVAGKTDKSAPPKLDRWSLGAWAFVREGSSALSITPGPAPIYGASQLGAIVQYRAAPLSALDPRLYLRGVRALIDQPENEVAIGVSARPLKALPVRVATEVRASDNSLGSDIRPAAYAISELPPVALPLGLSAEIYAAGGYVGGDANTGFIDGQAVMTRGLASFDLRRADEIRLSFGAGAWGGAQRGAHRVDVGPTVRLDMAVGPVPARLSFDYRERVGGDASPTSGVAATLSTQF